MSQLKWEWIPAFLFFVFFGIVVCSEKHITIVLDSSGAIGGVVFGGLFIVGILLLEYYRDQMRKAKANKARGVDHASSR